MNDSVGADKYVLRNLIDRHATERGDKEFVLFSDGQSWTYRRLRQNVRRVAASLQALGVKRTTLCCPGCPMARMHSRSGLP